MEKQELASLLKRLQAELESGKPVDASLRQSLHTLDQDIQQVLQQSSMPPATALDSDEPTLNARAQELEARFAVEHPYLASTLRQVMDTLGKMGI
jgi:hypothetical protein